MSHEDIVVQADQGIHGETICDKTNLIAYIESRRRKIFLCSRGRGAWQCPSKDRGRRVILGRRMYNESFLSYEAIRIAFHSKHCHRVYRPDVVRDVMQIRLSMKLFAANEPGCVKCVTE